MLVEYKRRIDKMMNDAHALSSLEVGKCGRVVKLESSGCMRRRMLDLGIIVGTEIQALYSSPWGDPTAYLIRGAVIAFRTEEASKILIEMI